MLQRIANDASLLPVFQGEVLVLARKIATVNHAVHLKHVTHRDVKPANLLMDKGHKEVKIADFGLAKNVGKETRRMTSVVGTPE